MAWLTRKRVCKECGGKELTRYRRALWMRLFRGSQYLRCRQCRATMLLLRGRLENDEEPAVTDDA